MKPLLFLYLPLFSFRLSRCTNRTRGIPSSERQRQRRRVRERNNSPRFETIHNPRIPKGVGRFAGYRNGTGCVGGGARQRSLPRRTCLVDAMRTGEERKTRDENDTVRRGRRSGGRCCSRLFFLYDFSPLPPPGRRGGRSFFGGVSWGTWSEESIPVLRTKHAKRSMDADERRGLASTRDNPNVKVRRRDSVVDARDVEDADRVSRCASGNVGLGRSEEVLAMVEERDLGAWCRISRCEPDERIQAHLQGGRRELT